MIACPGEPPVSFFRPSFNPLQKLTWPSCALVSGAERKSLQVQANPNLVKYILKFQLLERARLTLAIDQEAPWQRAPESLFVSVLFASFQRPLQSGGLCQRLISLLSNNKLSSWLFHGRVVVDTNTENMASTLVALLIPDSSSALPTLRYSLPVGGEINQSFINLGRNGHTNIKDLSMSRKLGRLQWNRDGKGNVLTIMAIAGASGRILVNDALLGTKPIPLKTGASITLQSAGTVVYRYRLEITNGLQDENGKTEEEMGETIKPSAVSDTPTAAASSNVSSNSSTEEFSCPICLDILVDSVTIVPCGHHFCKSCLEPLIRECPTCRMHVQSKPFPSRSLDHAIALLIDGRPDLFADDDVQQYLQRTNRLSGHQPSARKRAKHSHPGTNSKSGASPNDAIEID